MIRRAAGGTRIDETVDRMVGDCAGVAATVAVGIAAFASPVP